MIDYEKLTEVCGLEVRGGRYPGQCKWVAAGSWELYFPTFFNSPEGRVLVEEKVLELAGSNAVAYFYEPKQKHSHQVCISCGNEDDFKWWDSKFAVFAAALVWLVERTVNEV